MANRVIVTENSSLGRNVNEKSINILTRVFFLLWNCKARWLHNSTMMSERFVLFKSGWRIKGTMRWIEVNDIVKIEEH